ncbi:KAP family P-loop NTPase fold protein [Pseudomonas sp. 910_21]|uniref:KAP family P-loop NTPase fold protein n=1 Tax=Pseudomonas sp. 910_21 TaxID=2604460 RepID=UPI0040636625
MAKLIYRMITATPLGWSTRIGLYGQWGSGKTSVLNFLQQIAEEADDIVVRFPAWQATGEEGFIAQFYLQLTAVLEHEGLAEPLRPWLKRLSKKVTDTLNKVSNCAAQVTLPDSVECAPVISAAAHVSGVAFDKLSGMLQLDAEDLNALHQQLGKRRVIVFIDDLDRADPKALPQTLLALRELLDWPDFVFVLAFDKEVVSRALHSYSAAFGESAQHFLDKIIDVPFTLPAPTPKQVQRMVAKNLQDSCGFLPPLAIEQCAQWFPGNPRYAKRICRSLSVFGAAHDRHEKDELDWRGIILQTLLRESEPGMAEYFMQNFQEIISAFRPPMLASPKEEACNRHRQAALAMTPHAANSPQGTWALGLFEEVTKARIDSHSWLEKINYEMSLAVLVPAFTFPGLKQFFNTWREHRTARIIH